MRFGLSVAVLCLSLSLTCASVNASEWVVSDLPPQYIIERLKEVRQGWEELEIEYVQFEKRHAFDPPGSGARMTKGGRLVLRLPDCGEWQGFPVDTAGHREGDEITDHYVWTAEEFQIHWSQEHVEKISRSEIRERDGRLWAKKQDPEPDIQDQTFWQRLLTWFLSEGEFISPRIAESPKDCLPLVFAENVEVLTERFELSVMENNEHFFVVARPKKLEDQRSFRKTAICIDRETFLPVAKQMVLPAGDYVVCVVMILRVNGEEIAIPLPRAGKPDREDEVAATQ